MSNTNIIVYYLPAFHEIEENNRWYGRGFTEWNTTKNAKKLFKNHNQPRKPLKDNYYDLSNPDVLINHMNMAKKAGIYGFCFYHYWFDKTGKTVLQKPVETMMKNKSATIHYCMAWCNESWRKTWHAEKGDSELLIEQRYEGIEDWKAHFDYLLEYFKDEMYIKHDNKPMLLIYKIENIPQAEEMVKYYNARALENGFDGIYIVQMMNRDYTKRYEFSDLYLDFEPNLMMTSRGKYGYRLWRLKLKMTRRSNNKLFLNTVDYCSFCDSIVDMDKNRKSPKEVYGLFNDWDNSPRKGKRGVIFQNSCPKHFQIYLKELYKLSNEMVKPYMFLFAWNEWGEGGYLDPDEKYGYGYLDVLKNINKDSAYE